MIKKEALQGFNSDLLGLGSLTSRSKEVEASAAIFDLKGFTKFSSQADAQLVVPDFLNLFLNWMFAKLKDVSQEEVAEGFEIYFKPPFFSKFLGDGILFLWKPKNDLEMNNIITGCYRIWLHYKDQFLDPLKHKFSYAPSVLRCGIARGRVYSVGDEADYVGVGINLASRLQKLYTLTFAFSTRVFDFHTYMPGNRSKIYYLKEVPVRGIGNGELVGVLKEEFDKLPISTQNRFRGLS